MLTKDRVGAALAIAAAVIGLTLVLSQRSPQSGDNGPGTPSPSSEVAPGPVGLVQQPTPGQRPPPDSPEAPADSDGN